MCGIVAQFSTQSQLPEVSRITAMANDIEHRGPDDEGFHFADWYGLGFKRLSIIDLSSDAHQPMYDESKNYVIVFNGEIYNFKSIRDELIRKGHTFLSKSDTEVVLKSYIEWGSSCLSRFIGMFALIIVDLHKDEVFAARDQLGIKPLYYYQNESNIYFASEVKCFRNCTKLEINEDALYEQFYFRYVSGARTVFKNVYRLKAGNFMEFDRRGVIRQKKYYDVVDTIIHGGHKNIDMEATSDILGESIISHTLSDVGYNIQLSGGIDSSYIAANLSDEHNHEVSTYSVELPGFEFDEGYYQAHVSNKYNTKHFRIRAGFEEYIKNFEEAIWHMDFPIFGGGSAPYLMLLNESAGSESKVMLAGEGADELFLGYDHYCYPIELKHIFKRYGINDEISKNSWDITDFNKYIDKDIYPSEEVFLTQAQHMNFYNDIERNTGDRIDGSTNNINLLSRLIIADQTSYMQSRFEVQDKMGMARSVEVRVPYCIPKLFDLINSFEHKKKITPYPKKILKKLSEKYFDNSFIHREKIGFRLPFESWLRDGSKMGNYLDLITDSVFKQRGYYKSDYVSKAIDDHLSGEKNNSKSLVYLINFEIWHRMFIDEYQYHISQLTK